MKIKFISILFLFLVPFLFSCAQKSYDQEMLYGSWHFVVPTENTETNNNDCIATYKTDGRMRINCSHSIIAKHAKANYEIEDESEWKLEGGYYLEKTIRRELISIDGDEEAVSIIKKNYSNNDYSDWKKWTILKLDKKAFVVTTNDKENSTIRLELKRVF